MKEVYVGREDFTAQLVKSKLEDAGIEASILNEMTNNIMPYTSSIESMLLRVVVADDDYQRAKEVVGEVNECRERTECPFCGSSDIEYGIKGKSKFSKIIVMVWAALTVSPVGKLQGHYYCNSCKEEF